MTEEISNDAAIKAYIDSLSAGELAAMMRAAAGRSDYRPPDAGEVRELLAEFIRYDEDDTGLYDCHDNHGVAYQSAGMAALLKRTRLALLPTGADIAQVAPTFRDGVEAAAKKLDEMDLAWQLRERQLRDAGLYGPYLGAPCYAVAAAAIRKLGGVICCST